MKHKAGFVNIIGKPNVGKSTLMNALLGENLSIITSKAQTTRHRIMGFLNDENYQIVFSDTPGILEPNYKLQESMMKFVETALIDADVFLIVIEVGEKDFPEHLVKKINDSNIPVIIALNKIDLSNQPEVENKIKQWQSIFENAETIPVSALVKFNLEKIKQTILDKIPESPPYYDKSEISDKNMRFFVSEIIREKILVNFKKEIPYSVEIIVDSYKEEENIVRIQAIIYVSRESQKMIILGKEGKAIKRLGIDARKDIEKFLNKHIYLELSVKVSKDWRNNELQLKRFGYDQ